MALLISAGPFSFCGAKRSAPASKTAIALNLRLPYPLVGFLERDPRARGLLLFAESRVVAAHSRSRLAHHSSPEWRRADSGQRAICRGAAARGVLGFVGQLPAGKEAGDFLDQRSKSSLRQLVNRHVLPEPR